MARGHESFVTVAAGARTSSKVPEATPSLPAGDRLLQASIELPVSSAPCLVVIHVLAKGKALPLKSGWVRGGPAPGAHGSLAWHGDFPIPTDSTLFYAIENDTGGELTFSLHWLTARRSET